MLTRSMLSLLCCPQCRAELVLEETAGSADTVEEGHFGCSACGRRYAIQGGAVNFIPSLPDEDKHWKLWQDHLEGFQERRTQRVENPGALMSKVSKIPRNHDAFARFIGVEGGRVLDLGCGPGKFRFRLPTAAQYFGSDPITLPEVSEFQYVRALAEYMPFKSETFSHLVVIAALDHFKDLELFFQEARRVLEPQGRLHILQGVHEVRGPLSGFKYVAHKIKDSLEDRSTKIRNPDAPKHLSEFSRAALLQTVSRTFRVERSKVYSYRWYSADKLFLTLAPLPA